MSKNKYVNFEIDKGDQTKPYSSYIHYRILGSYYQDQNGKDKLVKEYVLSMGSYSNNDLLELILPSLNFIAEKNMELYLSNKEKYFEK